MYPAQTNTDETHICLQDPIHDGKTHTGPPMAVSTLKPSDLKNTPFQSTNSLSSKGNNSNVSRHTLAKLNWIDEPCKSIGTNTTCIHIYSAMFTNPHAPSFINLLLACYLQDIFRM